MVDGSAPPDLGLSWATATDSVGYNVYRSTAADAGFAVIGQPSAPSYDDAGVQGEGQSYYYLVTAVNACGNESAD